MPKSTTYTSTRRARESVAQANTARAKVVIDLTGDSDGEPSNSNSNRRIAHNTTTTSSSSSSSTTQALSRAKQDIADTYQALNALQQRKRKKATRRPPMSATAMRVIIYHEQKVVDDRIIIDISLFRTCNPVYNELSHNVCLYSDANKKANIMPNSKVK